MHPVAAVPQGGETTEGEIFAGMLATPLPSVSKTVLVKRVGVSLADNLTKTGGKGGDSSTESKEGGKVALWEAAPRPLEVSPKVSKETAKPKEVQEGNGAAALSATEAAARNESLAGEPEAEEVQRMTGKALVPTSHVLFEGARRREPEQMGFIVLSAQEMAKGLYTHPEEFLTKTDEDLVRLG